MEALFLISLGAYVAKKAGAGQIAVLAKYPVRLLSVASELKLTGKAKMNSVLSAKLEVAVVTGNTNAGELANTYCVVLVMAFAA